MHALFQEAEPQHKVARIRMSAEKSKALTGLCLLEFLSWGILFYTLPIASTRLSTAMGWSTSVVPTAYTLSLLAAAFAGPWVGRQIDIHGPQKVMLWGVILGAMSIFLSSQTNSILVFTIAWMLVGISQAATLYPPAFAAASQWFGSNNKWQLLAITFAGGLSSTGFAPLTAHLIDSRGFEMTFIVLAVAYGALGWLCVAFMLKMPWRKSSRTANESKNHLRSITSERGFIYSQVALTVASIGLYGTTLNLIPLLQELNLDYQDAAFIFGLVGAAQLLGRIAFIPLGSLGTSTQRLSALLFFSMLSLIALGLTDQSMIWILFGALAAGSVRGAQTLAIASTVSERWGTEAYASIYGKFNLPIAIGIACSPFLGEIIAKALGSYQHATLLFAASTLFAAIVALKN